MSLLDDFTRQWTSTLHGGPALLPSTLASACVSVLEVDGAGISVMSGPNSLSSPAALGVQGFACPWAPAIRAPPWPNGCSSPSAKDPASKPTTAPAPCRSMRRC